MDAFISYRRDGGYAVARLVYEFLNKENISAFLDLEELRAGPFNEKLYAAIDDCENFLAILPAHALDRCVNEDDWVRLEIEHALNQKKNIIPIFVTGFEFPDNMPSSIQALKYFNGVQMSREYFDASMRKIVSMLKNVKRDGKSLLLDRHDDVRYYYDEDEQEKHRLRTEDALLSRYEMPIVKKLLEGKEDVVCLDVNVLNPKRAYQRFDYPEVSKVIALTYNEDVAEVGNRDRENENVRFFTTQFEANDFEDQLESCLDEMGVDGVDFVCLSMAIMDFKKPFRVLQAIQSYLNEDAVMIVRDIDDGAVFAYPDKNGYFKKMQSFYIHNKYSGFRYTGRQVYSFVRKMEPRSICLERYGVNTSDMSRRDKKALFECWFSFIPNDFSRMLREDSACAIAKEAVEFCNEHYDELNEEFFSSETLFSSGYVIYSVKF
ncbi:MAG: toll/interleukin-1 receptor domain-containing protein [Clostridia bacterium]|nr:toll/interleukin-1 receptor domain-containing protein [Clostridia bacterium]